jgi:hypothetical protein
VFRGNASETLAVAVHVAALSLRAA